MSKLLPINYARFARNRLYAPRWIVFAIDVIFCILALLTASFISVSFDIMHISLRTIMGFGIIVFCVRVLSFLMFKTYSGIVRYTGTQDIIKIFYTITAGEILLLCINAVFYVFSSGLYTPLLFLWIEFSTLLCLMIFSRLTFKMLFANNFTKNKEKKNVIIYGSEQYFIMLRHVLLNSTDAAYNIAAFIDSSNKKSVGKQLSGIKIHKFEDLEELMDKEKIDMLIIAQKILHINKKKDLVEICARHGVAMKEVPNLEKLINGNINATNIRNIRIEDLLERGVIELDDENVHRQLLNKTILVTGAAGSIGSEIARQLTKFNPKSIILLDVAETPLYEIELEILETMNFKDYVVELASIRDKEVMECIFRRYRPDIVFHAAAYKHVPMIEQLPLEGVKTNIIGTQNVADLAVKYACEKFVMVSTDKAVNPTNVMGCTKRMAEIYTQSLNHTSKTAFITTRFGNVLGSNGSVIPRFAKQIEEGGPVTVTHPEITRFFMTIPEACQLVLQAGSLGEGGEIFVFDMGESVKIVDLAKNMIRLSGFEVGKEIKIVFTGLRPGEKLYEEVLNKEEEVLPTLYSRINRARVREYDFDEVKKVFDYLKTNLTFHNEFNVIAILKTIVPEFKSNNSKYEKIDQLLNQEEHEKLLSRLIKAAEMENSIFSTDMENTVVN